ncbi:MAG: hypothetical protein HOP15_07205 [Planctomycetes bacterium]|nr:hypothetical protein [Planctomycetota bacterium]
MNRLSWWRSLPFAFFGLVAGVAGSPARSRRPGPRGFGPLAAVLFAAGVASSAPQGRGDYLNFESPQVKPIAVGTVEGRRYLFVCNTPDNSVDVFSLSRMELAAEQVTGTPTLLPADPDAAAADRGYAARIPVGLEPVSVAVATIDGVTRLYTANWLGDSVTFVKLTSPSGISDEEEAFAYEIERVVHVGDEPMCVAVMNSGANRHLFVTKRTASSYSQLDPVSGAFKDVFDSATGGSHTSGGADVIMTTNGSFANVPRVEPPDEGAFTAPISAPTGAMAVKEPHTVAVNGTNVWVLGQQGGGSKLDHSDQATILPAFNLDLWRITLPASGLPSDAPTTSIVPAMNGGLAAGFLAGTGTTNFNLAANANWVYVVSTDAMNGDVGNPALLARNSGFVRTLLCKINTTTNAVSKRDLNTVSTSTPGSPGPVTRAESLAHCTDVAVFRGQKVCVVAFNSDRFAIVDTSASGFQGQPLPQAWTMERTNITGSNDDDGSISGLNVAGPRALAVALDPAFPTGGTTRPGDRIYVLNRLDHSISVIDPNQAPANRQIFGFAMPNDPVPDHVRRGQQFLYSAALGSGSGFVSCASCHIDGRSDQLQWRLGPSEDADVPTSIQAPLNISIAAHEIGDTELCEDDDLSRLDGDGDGFPHATVDDRTNPLPDDTLPMDGCEAVTQHATNNAKGPMITQSLQGLLNFEVASGTSLVTNAPYHWRGDKPDFDAFNEAFVNLQGATDLVDGNPSTDPNEGLTTQEMADYTTFINSVHYPPNHLEPRKRLYEGEPWADTPQGRDRLNPNFADAGSGTLLGLKLFHILPVLAAGLNQRSCMQCHFLSEGSNNRLSFVRRVDPLNQEETNQDQVFYPGQLKFQPIESAALRGLTQKEGRLEIDAVLSNDLDLRTGDLGLGHDGLEGLSRNAFLFPVAGSLGGVGTELVTPINDFTRRIDHGVAPIVGRMLSLRKDELPGGSQFSQVKIDLLEDMEEQVRAANSGLAVYARISAVERQFWYDVTTAASGASPEYQETPTTGNPQTRTELFNLLSSGGTGGLLVFAATPLGSERRVAAAFGVGETLTGSSMQPSAFVMLGTRPNTAYRPILGLSANLPGTSNNNTGYGGPPAPGPAVGFRSLDVLDVLQDSILPGINNANTHDAPRRLRVTAKDLVPGASLRLEMLVGAGSTIALELPIYPSHEFSGNARVWETAVELEPLVVYVLCLGGFDTSNTAVQNILNGTGGEIDPPPGPFDFTWEIRNPQSTALVTVEPFLY